jgi:fatty acid desaturase
MFEVFRESPAAEFIFLWGFWMLVPFLLIGVIVVPFIVFSVVLETLSYLVERAIKSLKG